MKLRERRPFGSVGGWEMYIASAFGGHEGSRTALIITKLIPMPSYQTAACKASRACEDVSIYDSLVSTIMCLNLRQPKRLPNHHFIPNPTSPFSS